MPRVPASPSSTCAGRRIDGASGFPGLQWLLLCERHYRDGLTQISATLWQLAGARGQGEQAWSTYWLTSRKKIQFNYRHRKSDCLSSRGERLNDGGVKADFSLGTAVMLSVSASMKSELSGVDPRTKDRT